MREFPSSPLTASEYLNLISSALLFPTYWRKLLSMPINRIKLESHSRFSLTGHMDSHWLVAESITLISRTLPKCQEAFSTSLSKQSLAQLPLTVGQRRSVITRRLTQRLSRILFLIWHQSPKTKLMCSMSIHSHTQRFNLALLTFCISAKINTPALWFYCPMVVWLFKINNIEKGLRWDDFIISL